MKKKEKLGNLKKKSNFEIFFWKKQEKKTKKKRKEGKVKKKRVRITVDYYCNPQWFRRGGTMIPPYHLDIV
jgi:hypothetical protein